MVSSDAHYFIIGEVVADKSMLWRCDYEKSEDNEGNSETMFNKIQLCLKGKKKNINKIFLLKQEPDGS